MSMSDYIRFNAGHQGFTCPTCSVTTNFVRQWDLTTDPATPLEKWRCRNCQYYKQPKWIYTTRELEGGTSQVKKLEYAFTHNGTIVEFKISGTPRRGFWREEIQPTIEVMKSQVPATAREFNNNTNRWSIAVEFWAATKQLFTLMQFDISETSFSSASEIPGVNVPKDYAENFYYKQEPVVTKESAESIAEKLSDFLGVKITTQEVSALKKLYRQKALELHPDRGGDAAKMSELNRLWTLYTTGGVQ